MNKIDALTLDKNQSTTPTPDKIRHLAELIKNVYSECRDRTVTIDTLIYTLYELADIVEDEEQQEGTK